MNKLIKFPLLFITVLITPIVGNSVTPSGEWTLADATPDVKDHFFRINVDPGEAFSSIPIETTAPSSVYFAQYVSFENKTGGYLGLQRSGGQKRAIVSLWTGDIPEERQYFNTVTGALPSPTCYEFGACSTLQGPYSWKVGHQYRFRFEKSPTLKANVGQWWQISLTDLTADRTDILGQLQTPPRFGKLERTNALFLEYFWGPYRCDTLRHTNATYYPIQGNWGNSTALSAKHGNAYGSPSDITCASDLLLPSTTIGSSSYIDSKNAVQTIGNQYRGVQRWNATVSYAREGIMYAKDPEYKYPVIWQAKRTGKLGSFPAVGESNTDWRYIGLGYPIINDLYLSKRPLFTWSDRNNTDVVVGDYFVYNNPYTQDIEYFKIKRKPAHYFPTNKTSNEDWEYMGRHFIKDEPLKEQKYHSWGENNRYGKVGEVFESGNLLFRLKTEAQYWYFPVNETSNTWWDLIGTKH